MLQTDRHTRFVKDEALRLGFDACGIAAATELTEDARRLEQWLNKGHQAGMGWIEKHFDLRVDPRKLVPGAKSVITLLLHYLPEERQAEGVPKISKYALGKDYHEVIRARLNEFLDSLRTKIGAIEGRGFVDSAPVLERTWAVRSGLGWVGKNGNLLTRHSGSFFFIATLITDLVLTADAPFGTDFCGSCTKCLDACPTGAIESPREINANKCISYLTIELKDELIPQPMSDQMAGWIFGCDICQDVCPWNRFSKITDEAAFQPLPGILNLSQGDWEDMSEEAFRKLFKESPIKRSKWKGMQRNVRAAASSPGPCSKGAGGLFRK